MEMIQEFLIAAVAFLLVLGIVVTVHELGHFLAAKAFGTKIDRFSIGFGQAIASWRDKSGVDWRIGWLPIGGYVRFAGDDNAASIPDAEDLATMRRDLIDQGRGAEIERYFHFKPVYQRAIIAAAGPAANFLLAIAIFAVFLSTLGEWVVPARIAQVEAGSPAAAAGLRPGDLILKADGRRVVRFDDVAEVVSVRANVPITFVVDRGGREVVLTATPRWQLRNDPVGGPQRIGVLGIRPKQSSEDFVNVRYNPIEAVQRGAQRTWHTLETTVFYLGRMITGQVSADQLRGPLGIATVTKNVATLGNDSSDGFLENLGRSALNLAQLVAVLSVSIGFMNLLPVPVLDGGHLLFYAYEAVFRRPLAANVQAAGYRVGLALVLGLMLFATWNDLQRLHVFKLIGGLFS
ncbi:MAG: RIP metalloprotease RseP [Alphaproteobacteria bacterium]|jgi:regulator of sigma E protease